MAKNLLLRFPHEYDVDSKVQVNDILSRYKRRMSRLYSEVKISPVIFIRSIEVGYGNYPPENSTSYHDNEQRLYESLASLCGHSDFVVLFLSRAKIFNYSPSHKNFYFIEGIVPFDNGFYNFNKDYLTGQVIFDFYKKFFMDFEVFFNGTGVYPEADDVLELYGRGLNSVISAA